MLQESPASGKGFMRGASAESGKRLVPLASAGSGKASEKISAEGSKAMLQGPGRHAELATREREQQREKFRRRKRLSGETVMTLLGESPAAVDVTKEMVLAFCDHLSPACLKELVLSSSCCLRLCFLVEHRLLELTDNNKHVRAREFQELSTLFGAIPWEVVEIGEKHFGLQLMEDLLSNDDKLWTETHVTRSFQDFLTHPTCRVQIVAMWHGPRLRSSTGYSAKAVHWLHILSHTCYLSILIPSLFSLSAPWALTMASYRALTVLDDAHFTRKRYNVAYTRIGWAIVLAIIARAVLILTHEAWVHIPNIIIVILEGVAVFRFTIKQEYLGTLQLAILRIGAEFYRFGVLVTALILIFAMALTVNGQDRSILEQEFGGDSEGGGGRKVSDWFPGHNHPGSATEFGQWLLELFLLVIFGADPRAILLYESDEFGGWARLLCMMILYCTFGAFSIVVLLNVLIAMCMSAYEDVQTRHEAEWQTLVFELARDYIRRPCVPPGCGLLFKTLFPRRQHWAWARYVLPGGRHLLEEEKSRLELKRHRAQARLPLFLDLVTSTMKEDGSKPKPATQAGLDTLRWQIENLQQVCCALSDQMHDTDSRPDSAPLGVPGLC